MVEEEVYLWLEKGRADKGLSRSSCCCDRETIDRVGVTGDSEM